MYTSGAAQDALTALLLHPFSVLDLCQRLPQVDQVVIVIWSFGWAVR